jgi:hypothetical protein
MRFSLRPARYPVLVMAAASAMALSSLALSGLAPASAAQTAPTSAAKATGMSARAQIAHPDAQTYSCGGTPFKSSRYCFADTYSGTTPVFNPQNKLAFTVSGVQVVEITCWYYGTQSGYKSDGVQDHVAYVDGPGFIAGHIPDPYINLSGLYPYSSPLDLPVCGT